MLTPEQRLALAEEARSWLRTKYHPHGRIKYVDAQNRGGTDCGTLLAEVPARCGIVEPIDLGAYSREFHLHHEIALDDNGARLPDQAKEELYVGWLQKFCAEITGQPPQAGDIALFYYGLCWSHAGIFVSPHEVVHSFVRHGVILTDLRREAPLVGLPYRLWSIR